MTNYRWVPGKQTAIGEPTSNVRRKLIVMREGAVEKIISIESESLLIGNKPHCELFLRDLLSTNTQLQVWVEDGVLQYRDLRLCGHARVNGIELTDGTLVHQDVIEVDDYQIIVEVLDGNRRGISKVQKLRVGALSTEPMPFDLDELRFGNAELVSAPFALPGGVATVSSIEKAAKKLQEAKKRKQPKFRTHTVNGTVVNGKVTGNKIETQTAEKVEFLDVETDREVQEIDLQEIELVDVVEIVAEPVFHPTDIEVTVIDVEPLSLDLEALKGVVQQSDRTDLVIRALIESIPATETQVVTAVAGLLDYQTLAGKDLMQSIPRFDLVPAVEVRTRKCALVDRGGVLFGLITNPFEESARAWLEVVAQSEIEWRLVGESDLVGFIAAQEQSVRAMDSAVVQQNGQESIDGDLSDLSLQSIHNDSAPVVKLVHSTLYDALRANVSDIHMETSSAGLNIRYRIDGVLVKEAQISDRAMADQVISRIKVMSELDISEQRIPQDGRFKTRFENRQIDFRVSIMPSTFGEDAVLRVLDKQTVTKSLHSLDLSILGFDDEIVSSLRKLSHMPHGMLLVTGPTGSGKTTTLYGALAEADTGDEKIITIEDPVEYQLPGVLQIPVNEKKGLTFARGLRSILRHDPDKIMVGEIRDTETAQIAIQSALTGHLVFTTVHANNVFDVLSRFVHMDIEPYSLVAALNGILAQRLVRVNCLECCEQFIPTQEELTELAFEGYAEGGFKWRKGTGCGACRGTGYHGRKAVGELLVLDDELREAIVSKMPVRQLKQLASKNGMYFLRDSCLTLLCAGETTIEEVKRVSTMA